VKKLISVVGPTGIGKTRLAIDLANHFNTEIVSCDSRQFFKEMKIGTASPSEEELAQAPHHFIGNLSVQEYYSIGQYEEDALKKLNELFVNHDTVILVGGSMMYEKAVIEGLMIFLKQMRTIRKNFRTYWIRKELKNFSRSLKNSIPSILKW